MKSIIQKIFSRENSQPADFLKEDNLPELVKEAIEGRREALINIIKLAEQGSDSAQYHLGLMYANGKGVAKNNDEALKWYIKSAEHGNKEAQFNLGFDYMSKQDYVKAYMWWGLAMFFGSKRAESSLNFIEVIMSFEQVEEAKKLIEEWKSQKLQL